MYSLVALLRDATASRQYARLLQCPIISQRLPGRGCFSASGRLFSTNASDQPSSSSSIMETIWSQRLSIWSQESKRSETIQQNRPNVGQQIAIKIHGIKQAVVGKQLITSPSHLIQSEVFLEMLKYHNLPLKLFSDPESPPIVAEVDGELWDLHRPLEKDCRLRILCWNDSQHARAVFWHSSAHILGSAMENVFLKRKMCTFLEDGPPISEDKEGGFFYDAFLSSLEEAPNISHSGIGQGKKSQAVSNKDHFPQIERRIRQESSEDHPFERLEISFDAAWEMFRGNPLKERLLSKLVANSASSSEKLVLTAYKCGNFIDLCRGPHITSTGLVKAFKLSKSGGVFLPSPQSPRGQEMQDTVIQRVSGISFPSQIVQKNHDDIVRKAQNSSHLLIQKQQQLVMQHRLSPGAPFFLPHGTRIYNKLMDFLRQEYTKRGFQEVITPIMFKKQLWEQSGHWDNYKENIFHVHRPDHHQHHNSSSQMGGEGCADHSHSEQAFVDEYALKPMNCPGHCLVFAHQFRNFRDLPLRLADFGVLHRNELEGSLTGLTRVRKFQQDDAHIFCTPDQVQSEISNCLDFIKYVYERLGFSKFHVTLSTRPLDKEKTLGSDEQWDAAEAALQKALDQHYETDWGLAVGDGAFYGPKIDITVQDALMRQHQCATIQLDFQLPGRFQLEYTASDGSVGRPVMIHRAILGSLERMMAILMEHTGGKWPLWLNPRQIVVCTVSDNFVEYAQQVVDDLKADRLFVDFDVSDLFLSKKVRRATALQYNYIVIVGEEEQQSNTVSVRDRKGQTTRQKMTDFRQRLQEEVKNFL